MATELPQRSSEPEEEVRYRKPRPDLYTALLVIALAALIVGCVMLYLELKMFDFKHTGAPSVSWLPSAASLADLSPDWSTDALATASQLPV
jgi:hypothetical protein